MKIKSKIDNIIKKFHKFYNHGKVSLMTQSGKPVDMNSALEYEKAFKLEYDRLWELKQDGKINIDQMRIALGEVDKSLADKYPMNVKVSVPKSDRAWKELILALECPVIVAVASDTEEVVMIKMDSEY